MIIIATYSNVSVTYTADGTQTVFSFPFDYLRKAFVFVEIDEETILTQGTDYSVSNKTVIFTTAPTAGTVLRIFRQTDTSRLVSWADASVLRAKDMTIQQVQELHLWEENRFWVQENAIIRSGHQWNARNFPIKNVGDPVDAKDAVNKDYADSNFMKLDDAGDSWEGRGLPVENIATPGKAKDAATKEYVDNLIDKLSVEADRYVVFDNVAAMIVADLPAGYNTRTLGYHDINDGGAGIYSIRGKVAGETEDGGSVIFLANGNVAELITKGIVTPEQFGAKGDGVTDDSVAIQNAVNAFRILVLGAKTYIIGDTIHIPTSTEIRGKGTRKSELHYTGNIIALLIEGRNVQLNNFLVVKIGDKGSSIGIANVERTPELIMCDVFIGGFYIGLKLDILYMATLDRVTCSVCTYGFTMNKDTSIVTSGTSTSLINCSAVSCDYGYHFERMVYSSLISCSCDNAKRAYYFKYFSGSVNACGCENSGRAFKIENYGSNLSILNFYGYGLSADDGTGNTDYLAEFETNTRTFIDRQSVTVDGLQLHCTDTVARGLVSAIKISGDARIIFRNLVIRPFVGFVPVWFNLSTPYVETDMIRSSSLPTKGVIFGGQQVLKPLSVTSTSYGWVATRGGCAYKENYDSLNSYAVGDYVRYTDDKVYICLVANSSSDAHAPTDTTYWKPTTFYSVIWAELPLSTT